MKYRMMLVPLCCLFLVFMNAHGQYKSITHDQIDGSSLTGNLQYDLSMNTDQADDSAAVGRTVTYRKRYSPMRAALFSAVIPGAGQLYTKSYTQSVVFLGAEVIMWLIYASNEDKGDKKTDDFQKYADENWSVVRYAYWIKEKYTQYDTNIVSGNPSVDISRPWEYVNLDKLNQVEDAIGKLTNTGFSHKLEQHGDQQYYEMIGKYPQFGSGWNDAATFQTGGFTQEDILQSNVSPNFLKYRDMRGEANKFYNIATTVSYLIVANHVFSALEAAWNASRINHRIKLQGHIQSRNIYGNFVEFVPTLHVEYEL